jgi:ankyrin repeat protein
MDMGKAPALLKAAESGEIELMEMLIDHGADVNHADETGVTPLLAAAIGSDVEVVRLLLANGADKSKRAKAPLPQMTALDAAILKHGSSSAMVKEIARNAY